MYDGFQELIMEHLTLLRQIMLLKINKFPNFLSILRNENEAVFENKKLEL